MRGKIPGLFRLEFSHLALPFLLAIAGFSGTAYIGYSAINELVSLQKTEAQARATVLELQNLLTQTVNAETGQRGFVITGRERYLLPYQIALQEFPRSVAALRKGLANDPGQVTLLDEFEKFQKLKFDELAESIEVRRNAGFDAAQSIVQTDRGREYMLRIREIVSSLLQTENQKLAQRIARSGESAARATRMIVFAGLANIALLVLAFMIVRAGTREQHRAARQLEDARNLLRSVIDGSPALIFLKDVNSKFILVNKAFEQFLGIETGYAIGKTSADLFTRELAELHHQTDRTVIKQNTPVQFEEDVIDRSTGQHRHFLSAKVPLKDRDGQLLGVCGVASDITLLKSAENEVRLLNQSLEKKVEARTEELKEANNQLEAFSYTVAHDLRAPLRGIQGFAQAIVEDYEEQLDDVGKNYLQRIERAAIRMEGLIEDLLSFARLARTEMQLAPVHLSDVLEEALKNLSAQLTEKKADVKVANELPIVRANYVACIQVLQNLLANALKFLKPGETPKIIIGSERKEGIVRLWIQDHGIGIAREQHEKIFQPFERLHGQEEYAGTGIGLAIVNKAMQRMGGRCGVQSELGKGSCFWIELPAGE